MLGMIAGNQAMTIVMIIVLALIALRLAVNLLTRLRSTGDISDMATLATRPLLQEVLPLLILAWLHPLDPTKIVIVIWWYVAAILVGLNALLQISSKLKK